MFDYTRFEELRAQKGITKKFIADKLNRAPAICTDWRLGKSSPNYDQMQIIADILDTTVEYLDGQTDQKEKPSENGELIDPITQDFVKILNKLTPEQKKALYISIKALLPEEE